MNTILQIIEKHLKTIYQHCIIFSSINTGFSAVGFSAVIKDKEIYVSTNETNVNYTIFYGNNRFIHKAITISDPELLDKMVQDINASNHKCNQTALKRYLPRQNHHP